MTDITNLSLDQAWNLHQVAKKAVLEAQATEQEALRTIARAAGTKTFMRDGQLYQIRERKDESGALIPFMCALKRPPSEWLAEARAARYAGQLLEAGAAEQKTAVPASTEPVAEVPATPEAPAVESGAISGAALFEAPEAPEAVAESTIVLD